MHPFPSRSNRTNPALALSVTLAVFADPALAQDVVHPGNVAITGNLSVGGEIVQTGSVSNNLFIASSTAFDGNVCVGNDCTSGESYSGLADLKIKNLSPWLLFEDTSTPGLGPTNDWVLKVGNFANEEVFVLMDNHTAAEIVVVEADAPSNALRLTANGHLGLGTGLPSANIHIRASAEPKIKMEQDSSGGFAPHSWQMVANDLNFYVFDETAGTVPFTIRADAPDNTLTLSPDGKVGIGLGFFETPDAKLQVEDDAGGASVLVKETSATSNPRTLLNLQNNGRPEIVMGNTATNGEWSFGAGTNFFLKVGAVGSSSGAKTSVFTVRKNGDTIVAGTLTTGGTTCGGGCDLVFSPDYDLPSIADHAARMKTLGYLPNVGPTPEGQPFNLTDKLGRMLNELEHAHLFIAQQQTALQSLEDLNRAQAGLIAGQQAALSATNARLAALTARLDALERPSAQP